MKAAYVTIGRDPFAYQMLLTLRRYQPDVALKLIYLPDDGQSDPAAVRFRRVDSDNPVLHQQEMYVAATPGADEGRTWSIVELLTGCPRVFFQSLHQWNAPTYLHCREHGVFTREPMFVMMDDEIDRLSMRARYHAQGHDLAQLDAAVGHTPAVDEAYRHATEFVISRAPFGDELERILGRKLVIHDVVVPIVFPTPEKTAQESWHAVPGAVREPAFKLGCYTKPRKLEFWNAGFVPFLQAQRSLPAAMELTLFGSDALANAVRDQVSARGVADVRVNAIGGNLPLRAYLALIEDFDALLYQHRSGLSALKHAVRHRVALLHEAPLQMNGVAFDNFNHILFEAYGIRSFGSIEELRDLRASGELDYVLAQNKLNLDIQEARAAAFYLSQFKAH
jgi:hypothetical protein